MYEFSIQGQCCTIFEKGSASPSLLVSSNRVRCAPSRIILRERLADGCPDALARPHHEGMHGWPYARPAPTVTAWSGFIARCRLIASIARVLCALPHAPLAERCHSARLRPSSLPRRASGREAPPIARTTAVATRTPRLLRSSLELRPAGLKREERGHAPSLSTEANSRFARTQQPGLRLGGTSCYVRHFTERGDAAASLGRRMRWPRVRTWRAEGPPSKSGCPFLLEPMSDTDNVVRTPPPSPSSPSSRGADDAAQGSGSEPP
ncbi:uncharacterized protein SCHCODRAFT_02307426 [Schizophyllum commune H4-8]|uniref:uncharacterized protein n=1 Tax=Schizophyllum commune (strain H4-8 / FGSC 9210) TaxID=578458 RepID=UPI00216067C7|nr:uncharacterized protein SCHCODRAFT_02307426 [Schizophyllum commune H4-8]KAI5890981.1 hypothetical protein SCHCODRAFT_02307426 [Schizophyllum commune H4-8]